MTLRSIIVLIATFSTTALILPLNGLANEPDSLAKRRFVHSLGFEFRPEYIFTTNQFLAGNNRTKQPLTRSLSTHLRYWLAPTQGSATELTYPGVYQGIGAAWYEFGNARELGNPAVLYLFQGARIARLGERLSLNYEWNFGLSYGWHPYDYATNRSNIMMGSKLNAYLNVDFYLLYRLSKRWNITAGVAITHFSNGNTKFPNAGLNTGGLKLGAAYNFGPEEFLFSKFARRTAANPFPNHISYDLTIFGSWRRKGVALGDKQYASPDTYLVAGLSLAAMYNFGYKFRTGLAVDGVYDSSANVYTEDVICPVGGPCPELTFYKPELNRQFALGLSARGEFVMPYFTVGLGLGANVWHKGGDLRQFYQMLYLKIATTRSSYLHIGYNLRDFHEPNYLMLGVGYRFNNRYPSR